MKPAFSVLVLALALVPVVSSAAQVSVTPKFLYLQLGGQVFGKITASAESKNLRLEMAHSSTCFTTAGSPRDVLKVTGLNTSRGSTSTMTLAVRAQHPGTCVIKFQSDSDVGTVDVTVKPEKQ